MRPEGGTLMRKPATVALILATSLLILLIATPTQGQSCKDETEMVSETQQNLNESVAQIKKESQADFEREFHQKSCLAKLGLSESLVGELVGCLDKAIQDPAATKEQLADYKTKRDTAAKLKDKITQAHTALKNAADPKAAKAAIDKFDFAN